MSAAIVRIDKTKKGLLISNPSIRGPERIRTAVKALGVNGLATPSNERIELLKVSAIN
jgi:hypothetical protein